MARSRAAPSAASPTDTMPPSPKFVIPATHPEVTRLTERQKAAAARAQLNPREAGAWAELAALAIEAGDAEAAQRLSALALRLDRRNPGLHYLAGRAARLADDTEAAVRHYRQALRLAPAYTDALISLASAERARQHYDAALEALQRAHALAPARLEIRVNLGNVMADRGDWPEAAQAFRAALAIQPEHPGARLGLAQALFHMNAFGEALPLLEGLRAIAHAPYAVERLLGRCRWLLGDPAGARAALIRAWRAGLADPAVQPLLLMDLIVECEEPAAGLEVIRPLLAEDPTDRFLRQCELDILIHCLNLPEAHTRLEAALSGGTSDAELAFSALQFALRSVDAELSLRCTEPALVQVAGGRHPELAFTAGMALLRLGDYARGLPLYERRLEPGVVHGMRNRLERLGRRWRGEAVAGRRMLVWQEQGMGDLIQMLRFAPLLTARGVAHQQWLVNAPLKRLLAAQPGLDAVHSVLHETQPHDLHSPDMSLAPLLARGLEDIPAPTAYLQPPAESLLAWQTRLGPAHDRLRVALCWAGNPNLDADRFRSVPPADLAALGAVAGVQWFNVQKGTPAAEFQGDPPFPTEDVRAALHDLAETAALFACMDLVISVDSAPVHLAGALGRPTWLLNRSMSEYRWMLGREDSPWYPSLRIFNQHTARQWPQTIERVAEALAALVAARAAGAPRG